MQQRVLNVTVVLMITIKLELNLYLQVMVQKDLFEDENKNI